MRTFSLLLVLAPFLVGMTGPSGHPSSTPPGAIAARGGSLSSLSEPDGQHPLVLAGKRSGMPFTKKGKATVKQDNADRNDGKNRCENCGAETVPPQQHQKGVTPPGNETQVDHVVPKSKGGDGDPENGQVLCRDCNREKSDK